MSSAGIIKRCSNCSRGRAVYRKGEILAWLCEHDFDWIRDGSYLAEDMSDMKDCKRWESTE